MVSLRFAGGLARGERLNRETTPSVRLERKVR
jgi:hypothetical protein